MSFYYEWAPSSSSKPKAKVEKGKKRVIIPVDDDFERPIAKRLSVSVDQLY